MKRSIEGHFSIKTTRWLMSAVGMWYAEKRRDQIISNCTLAYTLVTMAIAVFIESFDCYYSWGDLYAVTYTAPCTITVVLELLKLLRFVTKRQEVLALNAYTDENFWKIKYSDEEAKIMDDCNRQTMNTLVILCLLMQSVAWQYLILPVIESSGKNSTERKLPFKLWFNYPFLETPYYEICFTLEAAAALSTAICASTFSGFLFTLNFYAAGQFKLLQHRLIHACDHDADSIKAAMINASYANLRDCIKQHQQLIHYIERIEELYSPIMLSQALGGVLQMCFPAFQILLGFENSIMRTCLSVQFFFAAMMILYLYCRSCHEIIVESLQVAEAAYQSSWYWLPCSQQGKIYRRDSLIVLMRARRPCALTVGKFTPMSLETFASVMNTTLSYFTILLQMSE